MKSLALLLALPCVLVVMLAGRGNSQQQQVVAEISGQKLTAADLEQKESGKLLQARYQYYVNQRKALDDLIDDQLLSAEAKKEHLTTDRLLTQFVYKNIKEPTEDQLQVYYEGIETQQPYEAIRAQVLDHIMDLRKNKARTSYLEELRRKADIVVLLMPPVADVDVKDAYTNGPRDAQISLVEFADYECPYCEKVTSPLQQLKKEYGDKVSITYKDFPLPMHHKAEKAAEAARCAGAQGKFWEYHDVLFYSRQLGVAELKQHAQVLKLDTARFNECLDNSEMAGAVKKDLDEGMELGLTGTPSFFVNGHFFSGAADYDALKRMVDQQIAVNQRAEPQTKLSKR